MADRSGSVSATRLPAGCVVLDAPTARLVAEFLEIVAQHRPHLWTARDDAGIERVRRLRDLSAACATSATASDIGRAEAVNPSHRAGSASVIVSVQEAALVLQLTPRRVTDLLTLGILSGEQDAPGRPWRIDLDSVHELDQTRRATA